MRGKGCRVWFQLLSLGFRREGGPITGQHLCRVGQAPELGWEAHCPDYLHPPRVETGEGQPSPTKSWGHTGCWEQVAMSPKGPWIYFILSNIEKHKEENSNSLNFPLLRINNYINILVYLLKHFLKEDYC